MSSAINSKCTPRAEIRRNVFGVRVVEKWNILSTATKSASNIGLSKTFGE
jgi:hypothetical protein